MRPRRHGADPVVAVDRFGHAVVGHEVVSGPRGRHATPRRARELSLAGLLALAVTLGCSPASPTQTAQDPAPGPDLDAGPQGQQVDASGPSVGAEPSRKVLTIVDDAALLDELEAGGLALEQVLSRAAGLPNSASEGGHGSAMTALSKLDAWQVIEREIGRALDRAQKRDDKLGVGLRYSHRAFDRRWLSASEFSMELVAVVNRLDRMPFAPAGRCGETRLIYRLAYTKQLRDRELSSRLPLTLNVVFWQEPDTGGDCSAAVKRWSISNQDPVSAHALLADAGPLAPARLNQGTRKSVELDMQTLRWPATIRPDIGGHAEYLLAAMLWDGSSLRLGPLENTPDVTALLANPTRRAALLAYITDPSHSLALWRGTAAIPEEFLATTATSVAPIGSQRLANRPFSQIFAPDELSTLSPELLQEAGDATTYLRRLDTLSCMGCHQSRSLAGFHALGVEESSEQTIDALYDGRSPHLHTDVARREAWFAAALTGDIGALGSPRPTAEVSDDGGWGSPCRMAGTAASKLAEASGSTKVAPWSCAKGLSCVSQGEATMGICLGAQSGAGESGDPCTRGELRSKADSHLDRRRDVEETGCVSAVCNDDGVGFPNGMCTDSCPSVHLSTVDGLTPIGCGAIPNLRAFNDCLSRRVPFDQCVRETASPAAMRACDADAHCREDYVCARSPIASYKRGVCMPPYFLFQLRVDGHPV